MASESRPEAAGAAAVEAAACAPLVTSGAAVCVGSAADAPVEFRL